jgi:pyridoxamine 5'-phosphate oxidase
MSPFDIFNSWYSEETNQTTVRIPSACCLSTIGLDGYPNARFVSLKELHDSKFIFTGNLATRKGAEIDSIMKVALTFWWPNTERQVRIQGDASRISSEWADRYFMERNRESQIVSLVSKQGQLIEDLEHLNKQFDEVEISFRGKQIQRPENWGGYSVNPQRIEFLEFKESRFHNRTLYTNNEGRWKAIYLQP